MSTPLLIDNMVSPDATAEKCECGQWCSDSPGTTWVRVTGKTRVPEMIRVCGACEIGMMQTYSNVQTIGVSSPEQLAFEDDLLVASTADDGVRYEDFAAERGVSVQHAMRAARNLVLGGHCLITDGRLMFNDPDTMVP